MIHELVDAGNSEVVIEHNPGIMAQSDWIIDLGSDGGVAGGEIVDEGTPEDISAQLQLKCIIEFVKCSDNDTIIIV